MAFIIIYIGTRHTRLRTRALVLCALLAYCSSLAGAQSCGGTTDFRSYSQCLGGQREQCTSSQCLQQTSGCQQGSCQSNTYQCPTGTLKQANYCVLISNVCPQNTVLSNGFCQAAQRTQCLGSDVYSNGVCLSQQPSTFCSTNSQYCGVAQSSCAGNSAECQVCGPSMVLYNGTCVPLSVANCPVSSVLQNGICVRQNITPTCPSGSSLVNGSCVREIPCPKDSFSVGGVCVTCRANSYNLNDQCVECPSTMIYSGERCVCPPGTVLINSECEPVPIIEPEIERVIAPTPLTLPPRIVTTETIINDNKSSPGVTPNITNIVDLTNIMNSTNQENVVTNINNTNINDIIMGSTSHSDNYQIFNDYVNYNMENKTEDTVCCLISDPLKCEKFDDKYKCYKRRRHVCGIECAQVDAIEESVEVKKDEDEYLNPPQPISIQQQPSQVIVQQFRPVHIQVRPPYVQQPTMIQRPQPVVYQQPPVIVQRAQPVIVQRQQPVVVQQQTQPVVVQQQTPPVVVQQQQQPVVVQQQPQTVVVQQPVLYQQQPVTVQQPQPVVYQQPSIVTQQQNPVILQQPQSVLYQQQPVVVQQPQPEVYQQPPFVIQQQKPVIVQQPQSVYYQQQPTVLEQQQFVVYQQPQPVMYQQQPAEQVIYQQQPEGCLSGTCAQQSCVQLSGWPYLDCQNVTRNYLQ